MLIKEAAKKIRVSQPFNRVVTDSLKFFLWNGALTPEFVIRYMPRTGEIKTRLPNGKTMRLWSDGDELVTNYVFWHGWKALEPETKTLFFNMARESRVTFDVGAHIGSYAIVAALSNPQSKVYAFEPLPVVYERLVRNAKLNGVENLTCLSHAAGTHNHDSKFYHAPEGVPSSSSLSYDFMSRPGVPIVSTKVKVISLDSFIAKHSIPCVDLIKMDTEETEADVLKGMAKSLRAFRPKIICEVLRKENPDLEEILGPLGYEYFFLSPNGPVKMDKIKARGLRDNYLFLPKRFSSLRAKRSNLNAIASLRSQ
jgi:FkbM family methyltransferase